MIEPCDQVSSILTERDLIKVWPDLAQSAYADIRSELIKFTSAVHALEKNYPPPEIDNQTLLIFIGILRKQCIPQELGFVQALLTLALPSKNENIFPITSGFLLAFNSAYHVLKENKILGSVKGTIQEAANTTCSNMSQTKEEIHRMYDICAALHPIATSDKLNDKYKAELLYLLCNSFVNNELMHDYDVSRFSETIVKDSFIEAELNFTKALTKCGFKGAKCFVFAIQSQLCDVHGRKVAHAVLPVVEQHGFTGADEFFNFIRRNLTEYEQRKIDEPLLSVATQWGYVGFRYFQEVVDYLYISKKPSSITTPIIEYWRERFFFIAKKHGYVGVDQFRLVLQSSLSKCNDKEGNNFPVELAKQALLESYLELNRFKGILDYYASLPTCQDLLYSTTASFPSVREEPNSKAISSEEKSHKMPFSSVEKGKAKETKSDLNEQNNNTVPHRLSADRMLKLNSLIVDLDQAIKNATHVTSVTDQIKNATDNSLFSTKLIYRLLQIKPQTEQMAPVEDLRDQKSKQENFFLQAQLYFLKKLQALLDSPDLAQNTIPSIIAQAKENTQTIFKCENLISGVVDSFIKSIDCDASNATSAKMRSSMPA